LSVQSRGITLYIEPSALSFLHDQMFNEKDVRPTGDHLMAPWIYLREYLTARGVNVHTIDFLPPVPDEQIKLYVAFSSLRRFRDIVRRPDVIPSAFLAMECPVVEPRLFRTLPEISRHFRRILSWSDATSLLPYVGSKLRYEHFCWPQSFNAVHEDVWQGRDRKFLVMINSNRLPALQEKALYAERRKALEFFIQFGEIDLYGQGWNGPAMQMGRSRLPYTLVRLYRKWPEVWNRLRPDPQLVRIRKAYRGLAGSKAAVLGQYRFAICFENMVLKGWMTEKMFDCFFAGTVPVYWGAPDVTDYVPAECFIDMRQFADFTDLRRHLKSLPNSDVERYRRNARDFLGSPRYRPFTKEAFAEHFVRMIREDAGLSL
jgi:alpha(1,3/1,4) fucosyltransferase